jgi:hypothetical protein
MFDRGNRGEGVSYWSDVGNIEFEFSDWLSFLGRSFVGM